MIQFFRKIRRELLSKNLMGKYFKYAIGEILLVVIGILIALQINTWNVQRINQNKEQDLLLELKDEYIGKLNELEQKVELRNMMIDLRTMKEDRFKNMADLVTKLP